jgi:hypothetical protein
MSMRDQEPKTKIGFKAETGELFSLDKKERILLRAVLSVALEYKTTREVIAKKLGKESLTIAEDLLRGMGGRVDL